MKTRREWIQRTFKEGPGLSVEEMNLLQLNTGLSRATLQVCINRGLSTAESISEFLNPRLDQLASPNLLKDMSVAVERCVLARSQQQKIRIYGDYDVDGTTGGALLFLVLKEFGFQVSVEQPDRFKDGYGLNIRAVEEPPREEGDDPGDARQSARHLAVRRRTDGERQAELHHQGARQGLRSAGASHRHVA